MKNILLPTDFSENSWNAIKYAIHFFEKETCNFYLLYVNRLNNALINDSPYIASGDVLEDVYTTSAKLELNKILNDLLDFALC